MRFVFSPPAEEATGLLTTTAAHSYFERVLPQVLEPLDASTSSE